MANILYESPKVLKDISSLIKLLLLVALAIVLFYSKKVVLITLVGIGLGVLLSPLLDFLNKKLKLPRGLAALLVVLSAFALTLPIIYGFGWVIVDQTNDFVESLPIFLEDARKEIERIFTRFPWALDQVRSFDLAEALQRSTSQVFKGAQTSMIAIGGAIFAIFLGLYIAVSGQYYFLGVVRMFPQEYRYKAKNILIKCARVVRLWFRAQLLDMAIIGAITALGLWIIGLEFWALFGLLTAILGIIPFVGIIIVIIVVSLITLVSDPDKIYWVLLMFLITQQLEANLIVPMVMKGQVEIPEALLLTIMLFFGIWFGILGIFIAPAFVAVSICLYRNLYLPRIEDETST